MPGEGIIIIYLATCGKKKVLLDAFEMVDEKYILQAKELNDKYVSKTIIYRGTTKSEAHIHFRKARIIATIVTALLLLSAAAYAIICYYSTTIENTTLYWYTDNGVLTSEQNASLSPEDAAYELAVLFMDDLKEEKEERTFRVTEYKDLSVSVIPTSQMDEETAAIYFLKEEEILPDTWIVEISVSYKYEGILSPIGPSTGDWIDILYQGSPVGFLMTKEGNSYSLQSRYE